MTEAEKRRVLSFHNGWVGVPFTVPPRHKEAALPSETWMEGRSAQDATEGKLFRPFSSNFGKSFNIFYEE